MNSAVKQFRNGRDAWLASHEGCKATDIFTLENAKSQGDFQRYLNTRIEMAYAAGYHAGLGQAIKVINE